MYFLERIIFSRYEIGVVLLAADNVLARIVRHNSQLIISHLFSVYFTTFSLYILHNISTIFRY